MRDHDGEVPEHHIDGENPVADVGPNECQEGVDECQIAAGEREGGPDACTYRPADEFADAFPVESLSTAIDATGLPDHSTDPVHEVHPFTYETMCCVEDDRQYVELFAQELDPGGEGRPTRYGVELTETSHILVVVPEEPTIADEIVTWEAAGYTRAGVRNPKVKAYRRYRSDGTERPRQVYERSQVTQRWGGPVRIEGGDVWPVRPVREQCTYYRRQHFAQDDTLPSEPGHNIVFRNCTHPARRSIGGAAMGLGNEAVYGCDYRDPYDGPSRAWLDHFDKHKLETRPHLIRLPLLGIGGEVVDARPKKPEGGGAGQGAPPGGIFGGQ